MNFFSSADLLQVSNLKLKNMHTLNNHDAIGRMARTRNVYIICRGYILLKSHLSLIVS